VARERRPHQLDCERCARAFAKSHVEVEQRFERECIKQKPMTCFSRDVTRKRMTERVGAQSGERCNRGGTDETVEQKGNAMMARRQRRAQDGREFAPAKRRRDPQWVTEHSGMACKSQINHRALVDQPVVIDPGAAPGPPRATAIKERGRDRGCGRRVADSHLAQTQKVGLRAHRVIPGRNGGKKRALVHRRRLREIRRRLVERERNDSQLSVRRVRQLIDGGTPGGEIRNHLDRDFGRIRRDALCAHAVIAGKDQNLDIIEARRISSLPMGEPGAKVFQAAEAPRRLGELRFASRNRGCSREVAGRQVETGGAQVRERGKCGHEVFLISRAPAKHAWITSSIKVLSMDPQPGQLRTAGGALMTVQLPRLPDLAADLKVAISFSTRLPIVHATPVMGIDVARAVWALPIAGACVALFGALVYWIAYRVGLPALPAATLSLAATVIATGCLHEDGLADVADGFGGGGSRERKLEIMNDSRIGTYGACALVLSLLLRAGAIASLAQPALVMTALLAAHIGARAILPPFMWLVPPARREGLAAEAGRPPETSVIIAAVVGAIAVGVGLGPMTGLIALATVIVAALAIAWLSLRQINGQTGDVLGCVEQVSEILILLAAARL